MELVCYVHPGWEPRIRPASSKRDWMEATAERFAYRCLPLAIANAHGWEIGSPCGFEARWDGGSGSESVEIRVDPGSDPAHQPISLFGQGTVTFHVEGIFRTEAGWNLWIGGSPNAAKDGIAPLGGVIETDWSPYTFTMNWRFTRPGQWVRWEEDEPFCFFFPIQRGIVDAMRPELRPLASAPELEQAFLHWSASRDAFHDKIRRDPPTAPSDKWQKLYFRGVGPDGQPGTPDHQTKVRPQPMASQCPMSSAGKPVQPSLTHVPIAAQNTSATAQATWHLEAIERQRMLSPRLGGIPRVRDLSSDAFLDLFYAAARPVIIEGAIDHWPALNQWTPEYLAGAIGPAPIDYQGGDADPATELHNDLPSWSMPFDRFIDTATNSLDYDAYVTTDRSKANAAALAPLMGDIGQLDAYVTGKPGTTWVGAAGSFTPLRLAPVNKLVAQILGRQRIHLLAPSETAKLSRARNSFSDVHDITDADCLRRHPPARAAQALEIELGPGELLYVPVGWWHQSRSLSFSTAIAFTTFNWPNDPPSTLPSSAGA